MEYKDFIGKKVKIMPSTIEGEVKSVSDGRVYILKSNGKEALVAFRAIEIMEAI